MSFSLIYICCSFRGGILSVVFADVVQYRPGEFMHFCTMHVIMGLGLGWGCNDVVMWCKTCSDLTPETGLGLGWGCNDVVMWCKTCCDLTPEMGLGLGWGYNDVVMWCKTCCDVTQVPWGCIGRYIVFTWVSLFLENIWMRHCNRGCSVRDVLSCRSRYFWLSGIYEYVDIIYIYLFIYICACVCVSSHTYIYIYIHMDIYIYIPCIYVYKNQCTCPSMQSMFLCLVYHVCNTILTYFWLPCVFFSLFCTWTCKTHCE